MKDPILELVVLMTESADSIELDITLITSGYLVSGYVISKDTYKKSHPFTDGIFDAIQKAIESQDADDDNESDSSERNFIHLRDAKFFVPGQPPLPNKTGVNCRIKIEDVTGFSLGILNVEQS